jgi:hypothetical protein
MLCVCVCACLCKRTAAAYKQRAAREKKPTRTFYLFLDSAHVFGRERCVVVVVVVVADVFVCIYLAHALV